MSISGLRIIFKIKIIKSRKAILQRVQTFFRNRRTLNIKIYMKKGRINIFDLTEEKCNNKVIILIRVDNRIKRSKEYKALIIK